MYVYILRSKGHFSQVYVGMTTNLKKRVEQHNTGQVTYTSRYAPWLVETALWFKDSAKAILFEKYLKSHSGLAFRTKHF